MKLSQIVQLNSNRVIGLTLGRMATAEASRGWAQYRKLQRAMKYAARSDNALLQTKEAEKAMIANANNFWTIVAAADATGFVIDVDAAFDYVTTTTKPKSNEQLAETAKACGLTVEELKRKDDEQRSKRAEEGRSMKASFVDRFTESQYSDPTEVDPEYPASKVLAVAQAKRDNIATWDKPDLAELMLIRHDIEMVETLAQREEEYAERAGEASREQDDKLLSVQEMAQGADSNN